MDSNDGFLIERGLVSVSESEWELARIRREIIEPLAKLEVVTCVLADEAANKLNLSRRQIYALIKRYAKVKN